MTRMTFKCLVDEDFSGMLGDKNQQVVASFDFFKDRK